MGAPAARRGRPASATKLVLEAGARKVETYVWIDGKTLRMESSETYATPEAAKKAFDRLKKTLAGEGYKIAAIISFDATTTTLGPKTSRR